MSANESGESFLARFSRHWREITERSKSLVGLSAAQRLSLCPKADRLAIYETIGPIEWRRLLFDWKFWGRPKQFAPKGEWDTWISCGGRGSGKTKTMSEWVRDRILTGKAHDVALVGPTFADVRKVMIGGKNKICEGGDGSALLDVLPPWVQYKPNETRGEIYFPQFHCSVYTVSAEKPEFLGRNPDTIWGDEIIIWPHAQRLVDNLLLSNRRRGLSRPQMGVSTTPRPLEFLRKLMLDPLTVTVRASTFENRANLATSWIQRQHEFAKTRLGQQELEADMLGDNPEALFAMSTIERYRVEDAPSLDRIVVSIDPAISKNRKSDKTGIVGLGRAGDSTTGHLYPMADRSGKYAPDEWCRAAWNLLEELGASAFVVERNRGGDLVASNLIHVGTARGYTREERRPSDAKNVLHVLRKGARRVVIVEVVAIGDKAQRAEPLAMLYEQGRVHHVGRVDHKMHHARRELDELEGLEDEMTEWNPTKSVSPNSLDALVHGAAELLSFGENDRADNQRAFKGLKEANAILDRAVPPRASWLGGSSGRRSL